MENPNTSLNQAQYFESLRNRFGNDMASKTDNEISEILSANDDRTHYEREFALGDQEVALEDKLIDWDRLQAVFPTIGEVLTHALKTGGKGDLVVAQYDKVSAGKGFEEVVGQLSSVDDFKIYKTSDISFKRQDHNQIYLVIHIEPTSNKDDFGRKEYLLSPLVIELPGNKKKMNENFVYSKELTEAEFRDIKQEYDKE